VGGPVHNALYLTRYLQPDFETMLVVGEKENHEKSADYLAQKLGVTYVTIPGMGRSIHPGSDLKSFRALKSIIKSYKPDIVHTHAAKPGTLGRLAASQAGVPVILHTFHGHIFHSYFNSFKSAAFIKIERYLARKSSAIIAISEKQRFELVKEFKIASEDKFRVVPLGFDLDRFQIDQPEKRRFFRNEFNIEDGAIAIGIIGRLVPIKNQYLFLKAIKYVLDHSKRRIKAFIIGDGEIRNDLELMASEVGIKFSTETSPNHNESLVFTSWRSDIDYINAGLDIICLTSYNEGTPVSLIEAQAANKPIVSTRVGGISDVLI
jgi:glycosyltransferase involved in cell wall biosynthesis